MPRFSDDDELMGQQRGTVSVVPVYVIEDDLMIAGDGQIYRPSELGFSIKKIAKKGVKVAKKAPVKKIAKATVKAVKKVPVKKIAKVAVKVQTAPLRAAVKVAKKVPVKKIAKTTAKVAKKTAKATVKVAKVVSSLAIKGMLKPLVLAWNAVVSKKAKAYAAGSGRASVTSADVSAAAKWVLSKIPISKIPGGGTVLSKILKLGGAKMSGEGGFLVGAALVDEIVAASAVVIPFLKKIEAGIKVASAVKARASQAQATVKTARSLAPKAAPRPQAEETEEEAPVAAPSYAAPEAAEAPADEGGGCRPMTGADLWQLVMDANILNSEFRELGQDVGYMADSPSPAAASALAKLESAIASRGGTASADLIFGTLKGNMPDPFSRMSLLQGLADDYDQKPPFESISASSQSFMSAVASGLGSINPSGVSGFEIMGRMSGEGYEEDMQGVDRVFVGRCG